MFTKLRAEIDTKGILESIVPLCLLRLLSRCNLRLGTCKKKGPV